MRFFHGNFYLSTRRSSTSSAPALIVGAADDDDPAGVHPAAKLDYARPDRAPGDPQYDRRVYRDRRLGVRGALLVIALTGFLLEGMRIAMDQTRATAAPSSAAGSSPRRLTGLSDCDARGAAPRHLVVPRPARDSRSSPRSRTRRPRTCSTSFVEPVAARSRGRQAAARRSRPTAPTEPAGLRHARRLQPAAPAAARRVHEVRQVPRGLPGQRHRPPAFAARRDPRAARAAATPADGARGSAVCWARWRDGNGRRRRFSASVFGEDGVRPRRCGRACSATPAWRSARWGSSRRRSSTSCAAAWSRRASWTRNLQATLEVIHKSGNSFGENRRRRGRWTKELDFEVKDARKEPVDVLWFVGDYASFDPRSQQVPAGDRPAAARGRRRLRDPLRRRAQLGQRRAAGRRGGPVRDAGRAEHRHARRRASSNAS